MFEDRDVSFSPCHSPYLVPEVATEARSLNSPREKSRIGVTEARGLHSYILKRSIEWKLMLWRSYCWVCQACVHMNSIDFLSACLVSHSLWAVQHNWLSQQGQSALRAQTQPTGSHTVGIYWFSPLSLFLSLSLSLFLSLSLSSPLSLSLPLPPFSLFILCLPFFLELVHLRHWTP